MTAYFVTNTVIFTICVIACYALRQAPSRLRFYMYVLASLFWLVPWPLIELSIAQPSAEFIKQALLIDIDLNFEFVNVAASQSTPSGFSLTAWFNTLDFVWYGQIVFISAVLLGAVYLVYSLLNLRRWQSSLIRDAQLANHLWKSTKYPDASINIYQGEASGLGMTLGLIEPKIWVNKKISDSQEIAAVLSHELTHIKQHDHFHILMLHALRCLFWFNPLLQYLVKMAKQEIEVSCDEQCRKMLDKNHYQQSLIKLSLQYQCIKHTLPATVAMHQSRSLTIKRILLLNEERHMKKRYIAVCTLAALGIAFVGLSNSFAGPLVKHASANTSALEEMPSAQSLQQETSSRSSMTVNTILQQSSNIDTSDPFAEATTLFAKGDFVAAYEYLQQYTQDDAHYSEPVKFQLYEMLATSGASAGISPEELQQYIDKARLYVDSVSEARVRNLHENAIYFSVQVKDWKGATRYSDALQAYTGEPLSAQQHQLMATANLKLGNYVEAVSHAEIYFQDREAKGLPFSKSEYNLLLTAYIKNNQWREVIHFYENSEARSGEPMSASDNEIMATAFAKSNQFDEAIIFITEHMASIRATEQEASDTMYALLAMAYAKVQRWEEAVDTAKKRQALYPSEGNAQMIGQFESVLASL
ncbi:M56 family metallopeptidase [Ningiella sp. W23]|uniref:M56 family metallopeptidase n=1 Tax=Ningiella sp. W23 TaxID=3023715 RepID=UPI00375778D0